VSLRLKPSSAIGGSFGEVFKRFWWGKLALAQIYQYLKPGYLSLHLLLYLFIFRSLLGPICGIIPNC
jgi:hypothetical protein